MKYSREILDVFQVIGMEGSTREGGDIIGRLWEKANSRFGEVACLALTDENGAPRVWGLMSDVSHSFRPWENGFTQGLYLAGVEVAADAQPPEGWVKWESPAYEYVVAEPGEGEGFGEAIAYLETQGLRLAGAAYDRTIPGVGYRIYLPIRRI